MKENEEADKAANQTVNIPGITITRKLPIRRARNSTRNGKGKISITSKSNFALKSRKVPKKVVGNMRLN